MRTDGNPAVTVVLPTYNEQGNIAELIRRLDAAIDEAVEILVVDDASPDGTADEVRRVAETVPSARVIERDERGLTTAIQRGIDESRGDVVVWMDCDFSMPPELVPELVARVRGGADAAIGSRYVAGGSSGASGGQPLVRLQELLTRGLNRALTAALGMDFHDWTSGFIAIRRELIQAHRLAGDYGEYFIDLTARLGVSGSRLDEVPYATQVNIVAWSEKPDAKDMIDAEIVVERDTQKAILIGKGGQALKAVGTAARIDIETFLDRPVFLRLFVKVRGDWRNSATHLRDFGYRT